MPPSSIELLAPAGNWDCAKAALANGADAIYFGLPGFNARLRADNFTAEDLPVLMDWLHRHGARGFVAMNTLVFTGELDAACRQLALLQEAGVDAVIIQDVGLAALARRIAPAVELHASTQMTISSPEGLRFAHRLLGLDRAVLARELSLREIERFSAENSPEVPLEVFVHGALCVAYSGQCLTSEALGRRSANRGECAQACRMPYEMLVDGKPVDLGDKKYLLSPQDLAAHDLLPDLLARGVTSFKIEGRLKSPEYVAAVTKVYRRALDDALAGQARAVDAEERYSLEMAFSRGLSTGWLAGTNHPALVHARFGKKRGPFLGRIRKLGPDWVELDTPVAASAGDGIVFDTGGDTNKETGGRLLHVDGCRFWMEKHKLAEGMPRPGDRVWKTSDPALDARLRASWKGRPVARNKHPLHLKITGRVGQPLVLEESGSGIRVESLECLEPAERQCLDGSILAAQLGRLGDTPYVLAGLTVELDGSLQLPLSSLNRMRRELVEEIQRKRLATLPPPKPPAVALAELVPAVPIQSSPDIPAAGPELTVLVRSIEQLDAALEAGIISLAADFEDIRRVDEAVARVRAHTDSSSGPPPRILLATPRIHKAGENGHFKILERARPDGILLRNLGALEYFRGREDLTLIGDLSLNVANPVTARLLREQANLERLTISCDLNIRQVLDLLAAAPPDWFEIILHQHMPMFHMEHCVFCTFLSDGTDFTNCGRPCEKHKVILRDRVGMRHILQADVGCRNTLFRGQAQTGAQFLPELLASGLRHFRIDLLAEDKTSASRVIGLYQRLLGGKARPEEAWRSLKATAQLGVTTGTLAE